jgi:hypothetical protein
MLDNSKVLLIPSAISFHRGQKGISDRACSGDSPRIGCAFSQSGMRLPGESPRDARPLLRRKNHLPSERAAERAMHSPPARILADVNSGLWRSDREIEFLRCGIIRLWMQFYYYECVLINAWTRAWIKFRDSRPDVPVPMTHRSSTDQLWHSGVHSSDHIRQHERS